MCLEYYILYQDCCIGDSNTTNKMWQIEQQQTNLLVIDYVANYKIEYDDEV